MGIVLTQGSFDVFHWGHINFLRRSARFGDVYVAVITDESYEKYRGYSPYDSLAKRLVNVKESGFVKKVFPTTPKGMVDDIKRYKPDLITIGTDWASKNIYRQWGVGHEIDDLLIYIPYTPGISSTYVKENKKA